MRTIAMLPAVVALTFSLTSIEARQIEGRTYYYCWAQGRSYNNSVALFTSVNSTRSSLRDLTVAWQENLREDYSFRTRYNYLHHPLRLLPAGAMGWTPPLEVSQCAKVELL